MKISFHGAAQTVTGSKHLFESPSGYKVLLDCGMFQGRGIDTDPLNRHFGFNPAEIDAVILSHAHIDHSGLLPRLCAEGFEGKIYSTKGTFDLCQLMLYDSAHIQESDISRLNKRRIDKGMQPIEPLYTNNDVQPCLAAFEIHEYGQKIKITNDLSFQFSDSGHILGSAAITLFITHKKETVILTFTADIGRPGDKILPSPVPFPQSDYIICESTYGDRLHDIATDSEAKLLRIVTETCIVKKGRLIIPAFSVDRTQEVLYALDRLHHNGLLPPIKVFVDSPLSVRSTEVMQSNAQYFNAEIREYMKNTDGKPFMFSEVTYITHAADSKKLNDLKEPCIIISASGMAEAGRVKHHIKYAIGNPENTILLAGYCTPESLGGRLRNGADIVRIHGEEYPVKAHIERMDSYSAHADYKEMIHYLSSQKQASIKAIFLVHGEYDVMRKFKAELITHGYTCPIHLPEKDQAYSL